MTERRLIQAEDLLAFKLAGDPQLSPAGDRIVYAVSWTNKENNQYDSTLYMVDPEQEPLRFTGSDADSKPQFSPDGQTLAFISKRSGQPQVWLMAVGGGEARQLTKIQGGIGQFSWLPDGKSMVVVANLDAEGVQPEVKEQEEKDLYKKYTKDVKVITELFHKLDGVGFFGERRPQLCVVSLDQDVAPRQLTFGPYMIGSLADLSSDGQSILFTSMRGEGYDREAWQQHLWRIPVAGGQPELVVGGEMGIQAARFSPNGGRIAFLASYPEQMGYDNVKLYLIPAEGGEPVDMAPGFDRTFGAIGLSDMSASGSMPMVWAQDEQSIFLPASIDGTVHLTQVDLTKKTVKQITQGDRVLYSYSISRDQTKAVLAVSTHLCPSDLYLLDLATGKEQRLTEVNSDLLEQLILSEPQRYSFRAEGGPEADGWVMKPANYEEGKHYPAVLEVHGGPMMMYSCSFFFEFQLTAAQGYAVIFTNPRGSQGYGEEFCKAIQYEWGNKDWADVLAGLDEALAQNPWIDPDRVAIAGGSYGGYMSAWAVGHTDRFAAAVAGRPVVYWTAEVGTTDGGWRWMRRAKNVKPWIDDSWYKQQSPWTYVENIKTPLLIEVQEGDLRCPIEQGQMLYTAVKFLNKAPVKFVRYPNEFHGMSRNGKPWHRIHRLNQMMSWYGEYLK